MGLEHNGLNRNCLDVLPCEKKNGDSYIDGLRHVQQRKLLFIDQSVDVQYMRNGNERSASFQQYICITLFTFVKKEEDLDDLFYLAVENLFGLMIVRE